MPQTMISLLAIVIAMLFAVHQQEVILREYDDMVQDEFEIMSSGVALEVMEYVAGHPFDEALDDPDFILTEDYDVNDLAAAPFPKDSTYAQADYLEHFNGTSTQINFPVEDTTIPFDVSVQVHYLNAATKLPTNAKSDLKEVVVTVTHTRYANPLAVLSRTMSPTASTD